MDAPKPCTSNMGFPQPAVCKQRDTGHFNRIFNGVRSGVDALIVSTADNEYLKRLQGTHFAHMSRVELLVAAQADKTVWGSLQSTPWQSA